MTHDHLSNKSLRNIRSFLFIRCVTEGGSAKQVACFFFDPKKFTGGKNLLEKLTLHVESNHIIYNHNTCIHCMQS